MDTTAGPTLATTSATVGNDDVGWSVATGDSVPGAVASAVGVGGTGVGVSSELHAASKRTMAALSSPRRAKMRLVTLFAWALLGTAPPSES